jgi:hypothetical protein
VFSITGAATPEPQSFGGSLSASRRATRCRIVVRVFRSSSVASCAPIRLLNGWATKLIRRIAGARDSSDTPPDGEQRAGRRRVAPLAASFHPAPDRSQGARLIHDAAQHLPPGRG